MSTATVTTKTPAQAAYSGERRSNAAKWGWTTRRSVPRIDDETQARRRLEGLLADADPAVARLYACTVAETVMHHFTARYPGDDGCARAIAGARRLANGALSEWGRRRVSAASRKILTRAGDDAGCFNQSFHSAANAASWCTDRDIHRGVYWSLIWAACCADYGHRTEALERYCDGLEALK